MEESSAVENKELHKSLEKAKREAWMKLMCFFSVFTVVNVETSSMLRCEMCTELIRIMIVDIVDFFRRCLAYHLQSSTEEVSQLKDSIMTAKEECQSLQVQVNAQKAHEVKLEMQLQTLQEDLKAPRCLLKRLRSPK